MSVENPSNKIIYDITLTHIIKGFGFDNLLNETIINIFKDGRPFSHFIEPWLAQNYPLIHIPGCKNYDHIDKYDETIRFDQKTFTKGGCKFMPSHMIGSGRKFDKKEFDEHVSNMNYIIISNINFPEIKIKFVKGENLIKEYPLGFISLKEFHKFFN